MRLISDKSCDAMADNIFITTTRDGLYPSPQDGLDNVQRRPHIYSVNGETKLIIRDDDRLEDDEVVGRIASEMFNGSIPQEAILFVHGFNCSLDGAIDNAKRIRDSVNNNIPVVVYDWNSTYNQSFPNIIKGYAKDSEEATKSVRPLNLLLYVLLRGINKVHIMCHSMGSALLEKLNKSDDEEITKEYITIEHKSFKEDVKGYFRSTIDFFACSHPEPDLDER